MSRLYEPGNPPRSGVSARLWRKFVDEYGHEPDELLVSNPMHIALGSACWVILSRQELGSGHEILVGSPVREEDWSVPFRSSTKDRLTLGQLWWPR